MITKKLKFVVGTAVILCAVLALAITGMEESKAYYQTVPELKAMGQRVEGRRLRVAGNVVVGSIEHHGEGVVTFVIDYEGETLPVKYIGRGPLPGHARRSRASGRRRHDDPRGNVRGNARAGEMRIEIRGCLRRRFDRR